MFDFDMAESELAGVICSIESDIGLRIHLLNAFVPIHHLSSTQVRRLFLDYTCFSSVFSDVVVLYFRQIFIILRYGTFETR